MAGRGALFQSLLNAAKDVIPGALMSGGLTGGLALMGGASPKDAALYGLLDAGVSGTALTGLRALRPKAPMRMINTKTGEETLRPGESKLEMPVNALASIFVTPKLADKLMGGQTTPTDMLQTQQILQQNVQRDLLNEALAKRLEQAQNNRIAVKNAYSPNTMFQMQGLEQTLPMSVAMREELYRPNQFNLAGIQADMANIVGV